MRDSRNIDELSKGGIDWMGFIFYPNSSRYVLTDFIPATPGIKRVGVFVNEDIQTIKKIVTKYQLHFVQLHGNESPEYCQDLSVEGYKIIKAFSIGDDENLPTTQIAHYCNFADYFLFDTASHLYGGSGKQFNWEVLRQYTEDTPFLLSGGLSFEDAAALKDFYHPQCVGIDINSRFEIAPGIKNIRLIKQFVNKMRQ